MSRPDRSSPSGGPAAGSSARCHDGRCSRSPRGASASAARARLRALRRSGGEPLSPLRPTTSEHAPTALCGHAGHEAVLALPRPLLGLIGPLHRCVPFLVQRSRSGPFTHERLAFRQPARAELWARLALVRDSTVGTGRGQTRRGVLGCRAADCQPGAMSIRRTINRSDGGDRRGSWRFHCPAESATAIVARPPAPDPIPESLSGPVKDSSSASGGAADRSEKLD